MWGIIWASEVLSAFEEALCFLETSSGHHSLFATYNVGMVDDNNGKNALLLFFTNVSLKMCLHSIIVYFR
jgi:hypothetical protein